MKTLLISFINILICSLSLSILGYWVYLRISRKIYVIDLFSTNISDYHLFFAYLLFISLCFLLVISVLWIVRTTLAKNKAKKNYKFYLLFNFWYQRVNIFQKTYEIVFHFVGAAYSIKVVHLARKFINWNNKIRIYLVIAFSVLPRLIIVSLLIFEVYNKCLHYYFYSLLLLFIPLVFKFAIFMLKDVGPRLLPEFKNYLIFDSSLPEMEVLTPDGPRKYKPLSIRFKPEFEDLSLDHFLATYYYPLAHIEGEMFVRFLPIYTKINTITLVIYYLIHALIWLYILCVLV